jgi:hypothetical protein
MVVKSVKPLSVAKIAGLLYALMGFLFGAILSLIGMAGSFAVPDTPGAEGFFAAMLPAFVGIGAVVFLPIFYGCLGFITTLIGAVLYNLMAGIVGGVEVDVA